MSDQYGDYELTVLRDHLFGRPPPDPDRKKRVPREGTNPEVEAGPARNLREFVRDLFGWPE